ncbi:MAG: insulinase family protein [Candidatus Nanopelagicaceae bacterium]|nr:insulinase family protein [Candidatus Nanopelagicaceae bacterium]
MTVRKTVLPSGLRIVTEEIPGVRSAAYGIWVNVGSRDESPKVAGASHFLEHLLFKGTKTRSALDISSSIESVGGEMNAFTSKEYTCFYARVIDSDLPLAIDVISDLITSSVGKPEDVEAERKVVLEEISMRDDDPSDLVHELFGETFYGDTTLGRPILGTVESIKSLSRNTIFNYYKKRYLPQDIVVAVAGNIKHKKVVEQVIKAMSKDSFLEVPKSDFNLRSNAPARRANKQQVGLLNRKTEQAHIFLGMPGVDRNDERRFAMGVLSAALGGGMSSRLFQEIREKRGLAYSVYSYAQQFAGSGFLGFYAGCNPSKATEVVTIMRDVLHDVANNGLTHEELSRAQGAVRGTLVLSQEDTGSRMSRIGKSELVYGEIMTFDQILKAVADVSSSDIRALADEILHSTPTLAVVGPFSKRSVFERVLK